MNKLQKNYLPPQLTHHYDFTDEDYFEQSDYQDENELNIGIHNFRPDWNSVTPSNLQNINCFCPYCGHFVKPSQQMICQIQGTKGICLGHKKCILKQQNQQIEFQYQKSPYTIQKGSLEKDKLNSVLGQKEYVLSSIINHPLSDYKYLKMDKKIVMTQGQFLINMQNDFQSENSYQLNNVIVPIPQIHMKLEMKEIGSKNEGQKINLNVDLSQIFVGIQITEKHSDWIITTSNTNNWIAKVQLRLIFDDQEKKRQVQKMNFKYSHQLIENLPLVKLNKILVRSKEYETIMRKSFIENTKASSSYEDIYEELDQETSSTNVTVVNNNYPSIRIIQPPLIDKEVRIASSQFIKDSTKMQNSQSLKCKETKMQNSQHLKDIRTYAKTQNGSKQLQRTVRQMRTTQRDQFIDQISYLLCEFIQNDYANYMVQTLISCSNSKQRLKVFQLLKDQTIDLVCLKQGTFAFQQMICYMETHQEYMMMTKLMLDNFIRVATDANGNHFLRKLIPTLPFWYNDMFIQKVIGNFLQLVNNKNSVCVLKVILHTLGKQTESDKIRDTRKKLIQLLSLHTQKIIKNQYGNYFLQQAFEVFGQFQLKSISEQLFLRFKQLAKEKFSSSVLCKCISNYWRGTSFYQRLKGKMSNSQVLQLFKNKQGNKVLLQLMFSPADNTFKSRICSVIGHLMPSKFNSSKWNNATGIKTNNNRMVSSEPNYLSLSDTMGDYQPQVKISPMAKKRPYIIQ